MFSLIFWCKDRSYSILESNTFELPPVEGEKRKVRYGKNYYVGKILKIDGNIWQKIFEIIFIKIFLLLLIFCKTIKNIWRVSR